MVGRLKNVIRRILLQFVEKTQEYKTAIDKANTQLRSLSDMIKRLEPENERLRGVEREYIRLLRYIGNERADEMIQAVIEQEIAEKRTKVKHEYVR